MLSFFKKLFKKKVKIEKVLLSSREQNLIFLIGRSRKISGCLKLNKIVFLIQFNSFKENTLINFDYNYSRYIYGPFDMNIYRDLRCLEYLNVIKTSYENGEKTYSLTELGHFNYELIESNLPDCFKNEVDKVLCCFLLKNRDLLLKEVYEKSDAKSFEIGDDMSSVFKK